MSEEAAFLKAIKRNPKDRTARLVFADWLQERDDPRAEWVRDDELWKWMKPDAAHPFERILADIRRGRDDAVHALTRLGPSIVPELLAALPDLQDSPAGWAKYALRQIGPSAEAQLPALLKAVKSQHANVRAGAFWCLAGLVAKCPDALAQMLAGLDSADREVREIAVGAICESGANGPEVAPKLTDLVRRGVPGVFRTALMALEKLGPLDHSLIPDLVRHLGHSDLGLPDDAAEALGRIGLPAARPILAAARTGDDGIFGYNSRAQKALGAMKRDVFPVLREALETNPSKAVRQLAAKTWDWLRGHYPPDADSLPWISETLQSDDFFLCWSGLRAIQKLGPVAVQTLPAVLALATDLHGDSSRCGVALDTIPYFGPAAESTIPALLAHLATIPREIYRVMQTLARMGRGASAIVILLGNSPKKQPSKYDAVLNGLYLKGDVHEDVTDVQSVILRAYEIWGPGRTLAEPARIATAKKPDVTAIRAYLEDASLATRLVAVFALWHVGTPDAVAGLLAALQDKHKVIRTNAARALARTGRGGEGVSEALRAAKKDRAKDVRAAAAKALKRG